MKSIADILLLQFSAHSTKEATLSIYEHVPFDIKRVFVISSGVDAIERGHHAHQQCQQLLIALKGRCIVTCDDGHHKSDTVLDSPEKGLLIPPTIWASQNYDRDTTLMVLADQYYDEDDYIRDYNQFLTYRGVHD